MEINFSAAVSVSLIDINRNFNAYVLIFILSIFDASASSFSLNFIAFILSFIGLAHLFTMENLFIFQGYSKYQILKNQS
jgi:hypothetical protein